MKEKSFEDLRLIFGFSTFAFFLFLALKINNKLLFLLK